MRGITDPEFQKVGGMNSCYCTINSFYGGMNLGTGWHEFILGWHEFIILMDAYTDTLFLSLTLSNARSSFELFIELNWQFHANIPIFAPD